MHVLFISACEKRALKKSRAVLDSYALRVGHGTWTAPMTLDGLKECRTGLRRVATRQTAVACYINDGRKRMKLLWTVGNKHKFGARGEFPVGSTQKNTLKTVVPEWVRSASLLAGAAGDMHDIGKASAWFQDKLKNNEIVKDKVRHEWLSMKLLQRLRHNGWQWRDAWTNLASKLEVMQLGDSSIKGKENALENELEAVDYLVVTHHGLLGNDGDTAVSLPNASNHIRNDVTDERNRQFTCAGDLEESIFISHQHRMARLSAKGEKSPLYWKALSVHARAALIFADHTISALSYMPSFQSKIDDSATQLLRNTIYANTKFKDGKRFLDQPLNYHLQQVGDRAARVATQMVSDLDLAGLSEQTIEQINKRSLGRFEWQNKATNSIAKIVAKHPDTPALILNIAATGSGKTRMNLRAACMLRPESPRIAIALNLRSLTLQTGSALQHAIGMGDDELSVIIGDKTVMELYQKNDKNQYVDEDENLEEPAFDIFGEENDLPEWLKPLYRKENLNRATKDESVLTAPLLVSTIDYLIAAGEPHKQGHHVKALLRVMSSDLILDEIDSYEPQALIAVLRVVQLSAMYGRHVICSSATLSLGVAQRIEQAFRSGIGMRVALEGQPVKAIYGLIDDVLPPKLWVYEPDNASLFNQHYQVHLDELASNLSQKPVYRLAQLQPLDVNANYEDWQIGVMRAAQQLHLHHSWIHTATQKKMSIGLIRVAHVKVAVELAQYLCANWSEARVACYHANDWLLSRFYKEQRLDELLTRHKNDHHLQQDAELQSLAQQSEYDNIPLIIIATPVEEIGRDHCFDWGVIDVSSCQSLVQTAGRINRHRLIEVNTPNIAVMQYNAKYCRNSPNGNSFKVFTKPGYEGYGFPDTTARGRANAGGKYTTHDVAQLLPWEDGQLVINATLRFDVKQCLFAKNDDLAIENFIKAYIADHTTKGGGDGVFTIQHLATLGENPYNNTKLRQMIKKEVYFFKQGIDEITYAYECFKTNDYGQKTPDHKEILVHLIPTHPHAWLVKTPEQLLDMAEELNIDPVLGCRVELAIYNKKHAEVIWSEQIGFGLYLP